MNYYCFSGHHLVRVRAQVMMREDSTGGWVPLGGGGLSHVAVRKRKIHHEDDPPCKHEYLIYGKRINDQRVSRYKSKDKIDTVAVCPKESWGKILQNGNIIFGIK